MAAACAAAADQDSPDDQEVGHRVDKVHMEGTIDDAHHRLMSLQTDRLALPPIMTAQSGCQTDACSRRRNEHLLDTRIPKLPEESPKLLHSIAALRPYQRFFASSVVARVGLRIALDADGDFKVRESLRAQDVDRGPGAAEGCPAALQCNL